MERVYKTTITRIGEYQVLVLVRTNSSIVFLLRSTSTNTTVVGVTCTVVTLYEAISTGNRDFIILWH
jgi:hypothetical protein